MTSNLSEAERPATWARPALLALLLATAVLYLAGLGASGWANAYYAMAAQAGSQSWQAWFYGSLDAANSITIDKAPASLWVMGLSVRLFGLSSWSLLVPQALMGVAAVGVLYAAVRRWYGPVAGLFAGAALALTPVAALMFRFNNPDALLVLLLVLAAYATVRATERASTGWLVAAGAFVGFGFLAKMLQALLVVPALAVTYLVAAPARPARRLWQLALAGGALIVSAGWYIAVVELVPASARPYIGGSQHNSLLELTLGYNGIGRVTGEEVGSVGGGQGGGWGETGWGRLFGTNIGGQIAWLLPAALLAIGVGFWVTRSMPRTDRVRAGFVLWGGWLLVTAAVFSQMQGIFHEYYTVALAPPIGALVGAGATLLWSRRHEVWAAVTLGVGTGLTAAWSVLLLTRSAGWQPWLRWLVLLAGLASAAALLVVNHLARRAALVVAATAVVAMLAGPAAYAVQTASTPHAGAIVTAGPGVTNAGPGGRVNGPRNPAGGQPGAAPGGMPDGIRDGRQPAGPGNAADGAARRTQPAQRTGGGLLDAQRPDADLVALLSADADAYTWVAATVGANNAAGYQLATGRPVMAIGGFNGSDPSPTLAQFQQYVADGRVHYFLGGGGFRADGGSSAGSEIAAWVAERFTARTVGGVTVYDLTERS